MDLDAKPYRYFVRIAETGSFTRAAEQLHVSQPALSAQMRELERRLGFRLFHREGRRISLTAEGRIFLDRARRLVIETDWLNQSVRDIRENQLRIGAAHHSAAFPVRRALIERFLMANPDIPLTLSSRTHAQLFEDLRAGVIDVALTIEPLDGPVESAVEPAEPGFDRRTLATLPTRIAIPEGHALASADGDGSALEGGRLAGQGVATISRVHGIRLSEAVARGLIAMGARLIHPPEGDAQSVLRYAAAMGWPAIDLGWPGEPPPGLRSIACPDLGIRTQFVLLSLGEPRPAARRFIEFATAVPGG